MGQPTLEKGRRSRRGTPSVVHEVDDFLDARAKGAWPISLAQTTLAVRRRVPDCEMTDRELSELVAIRAVERGHNVMFDADLLGDGGSLKG